MPDDLTRNERQTADGRWVPSKPLPGSSLIRLELALRALLNRLRGGRRG